MELEIRHDVEGDYDVLAPRGELDLSSYVPLKTLVSELLDAGRKNIVVDLSETDFLDSTALGAFIGGRRRAYAAGGSFVIVCGNPRLMKIFTITKLDLVFTVLPSKEAWRESVGLAAG